MLNQLITPMNFIIVRDGLAEIIISERDNQVELALSKGYSSARIDNEIDFNVYSALWRPVSVEDLPAVAVYIDNMNFPTGRQYGSRNHNEATYNIDCFAVGQNGEDEFGNLVYNAEQNADRRLNYLVSQVYKILYSEKNWFKGARGVIESPFIVSAYRIQEPEQENEEYVTLGYRIQLRLGFEEPTQMITGVELREIYTTLKIREELIDPFVLAQIEQAEEEDEEDEEEVD